MRFSPLAFLAATSFASAQSRTTVADVLKWSAAERGPLLAIDASTTRAKDGKQLADFGRKVLKVGDLNVVAPSEMVVIDDSFRQPANLSDGLPRDAKVLYLMQSLTPQQWKKIVGQGISHADLEGEQRVVFQSLLPDPIKWTSYRTINESDYKPVDSGLVSGKELLKVKLRVYQDFAFEVELANERAFTSHDTSMYRGSAGTITMERDHDEEASNFGTSPRQTVPNRAKLSQLPYTDTQLIRVPPGKVRDLLAVISRSTGREIHADLRVADREVSFFGGSAKAGDLLQALALAVTGTYRQVGSAYVLTSDNTGLGARKLLFAMWWDDLMRRTFTQTDKWRRAIGNRIDQVQLDADNPFKPSEGMKSFLAKQDGWPPREWMSAQDATPQVRAYLGQLSRAHSHQPLDPSKLRPISAVRFGFVLPDGRRLRSEHPALGQGWQFLPRHLPNRPAIQEPKLPVAISKEGKPVPLVAAAEEVAAAKSLVSVALLYGFRELWLETRNPAALKAAIEDSQEAAISIRLLIRPWISRAKGQEIDRTILGDTGSSVDARLALIIDWAQFDKRPQFAQLPGQDRFGPLEPSRETTWKALIELSKAEGLAGVVLSESGPPGYEPLISPRRGGYSRVISGTRSFGFPTSMRLAFLRKHGIDPLDIVGPGLTTSVELRQPFFLDEDLQGVPTNYQPSQNPHPKLREIAQVWNEFRYKLNEEAILDLLAGLAAKGPVMVDARPNSGSLGGAARFEVVYDWKPGDDLFFISIEAPGEMSGMQNPQAFMRLPAAWPVGADHPDLPVIAMLFVKPENTMGLDVRHIATKDLRILLSRWFVPSK